jgi:hypothetical protein
VGEMRNACSLTPCRKAEGQKPLGRPKHRWDDNIKMTVKETGPESVSWCHLTQNGTQWRILVNTVVNLRVQLKAVNFLSG